MKQTIKPTKQACKTCPIQEVCIQSVLDVDCPVNGASADTKIIITKEKNKDGNSEN